MVYKCGKFGALVVKGQRWWLWIMSWYSPLNICVLDYLLPKNKLLVDQAADEMCLLSGLAFDKNFRAVFAASYASVDVYRFVGSCFKYKVDIQ